MLDSNMTMSQHVLRVCQNCYFQIRLIRRLGKALSVESKRLLVHALVHSRLDYCNSVLVRLPWSLVQQLQSLLNSAARSIFGLKRFDRITPALMDLHWLPYPQRITYKLCMIMFKCLRGSAPAYLADYYTSTSLVPFRSALRSAAHGDIVVPSHRTDWSLRSFAMAGPSSWNALPVDLRSSFFGLDTFAKHLKTPIRFGILMNEHALLSLYHILQSATRWQCHQNRLLLLLLSWLSLGSQILLEFHGWLAGLIPFPTTLSLFEQSRSTLLNRGVARVFGARGADFRFAPPPPPVPVTPNKFVIHQNLRNRLSYSKIRAIYKQIKILVGWFLVVGDHLDPTFPYFWKIVPVFCQCGGVKTSSNNVFLEKQTEIIL